MLCQLGMEYLKLGREKEGEEVLNRSIAINPKQLETSYALAKLSLRRDSSQKSVNKAIELLLGGLDELKSGNVNPKATFAGDKNPVAPMVYALLVDCYQKLNDSEAALEIAQEWSLQYHSDAKAFATVGLYSLDCTKIRLCVP